MVITPELIEDLENFAERIRNRVFAHVLKNNGGYLSQALSAGEIFAALYGAVLKLGPVEGSSLPTKFPGTPGPHNQAYISGARFNGSPSAERDRFLFSPAHYALVLYTALIEAGRLDPAALDQFNADGGTMEMIGAEHSPGVETTTGSLAQALSQASGIALARQMRGETGRTWVFMSDGEFQEGQTYEALQFAAYHRLAKLRAVVDANGQQCDGAMDDVMSIEPVVERVRAFGCEAVAVDGHDMAQLVAALEQPTKKPLIVIARTNPTHTLPLLAERSPVLHYLRFGSTAERERYQAVYDQQLVSV